MNRSTTFLATVVAALLGCATSRPAPPAAAEAPVSRSGIDLAGMDRSVVPGADFYAYANGTWQRSAVIPPDRAFTGPLLAVVEKVAARTRAIDEEAAASSAPEGSEARQIGDYYASFMDEAGIEAKGLSPIAPALARIAGIGDKRALAEALGGSIRADVDPLNMTEFHTARVLGLWVEQDLNASGRNTAYLLQGGLGLPDCSYYTETGARFEEIRNAYRAHLRTVLKLAGMADADGTAERIFALETRIARTHASRTDSVDVQKANNPWTRADFDAKAPGLDWTAFLGAAGLGDQQGFILWHPGAVSGLAALVRDEPLSTWKEYLALRAVDQFAPFLPKALADEHFRFYGTALRGTPKQLERWKRATAATDAALGDAVGKVYAARYFPPEDKRELQSMVDQLIAAFGRRIDRLEWMTPSTKAQAKAKLATLKVGIAYPDHWRSYAGLVVVRGDALGNAERSELFAYRYALAKLRRPPDASEWAMLPQTVNAVNLPVRNALNFAAGYLEPPFYDRTASPAVKYASVGATIGHEISHSFDDQGALFDAAGRLANWWTPEDERHFQQAGARLVAQFDAYRPFPDLAVNGRLTLSENIADLAGLAVAYDGWRASLHGAGAPELDGLTGDQQFFVAYAQGWRSKEREESLRETVQTNGHAPDQYRALTVRNLDAWYGAFDVKPGQALYLAPADRVRVW
ncbi:MAG TPA: M13 family metallopeptidase [Anaeromyxobacteraceae bacterium]|nr:M13 family metallopeptidase [Anaeromyxobacteraceae bacterium]